MMVAVNFFKSIKNLVNDEFSALWSCLRRLHSALRRCLRSTGFQIEYSDKLRRENIFWEKFRSEANVSADEIEF